jgi:hypothetical protein
MSIEQDGSDRLKKGAFTLLIIARDNSNPVADLVDDDPPDQFFVILNLDLANLHQSPSRKCSR